MSEKGLAQAQTGSISLRSSRNCGVRLAFPSQAIAERAEGVKAWLLLMACGVTRRGVRPFWIEPHAENESAQPTPKLSDSTEDPTCPESPGGGLHVWAILSMGPSFVPRGRMPVLGRTFLALPT